MFPTSAGDSLQQQSESATSSPTVSFDDGTMKENADNADHRAYRKTPHPDKKRPVMVVVRNKTTSAAEVEAEGTGSDVCAARANDEESHPLMLLPPDNNDNCDGRDDDRSPALNLNQPALPRRLRESHDALASSFVPTDTSRAASASSSSTKTGGTAEAGSSTGNDNDGTNDGEEDMEDVDMEAAMESEAEAAAAKWAAFCDEIRAAEPPTSAARQNLEEYEQGKGLRNKSTEGFSSSYERRIRETMESQLWGSLEYVKASLEEWASESAQRGSEVGRCMKENHQRRTELRRQVLDAYEQIGTKCRGLAASVMNEADSLCCASAPPNAKASDGGGRAGDELDDSMVAVEEGPDAHDGKANKRAAVGPEDPQEPEANGGVSGGDGREKNLTEEDWDALLSYEPTRENTQALIDANAFLAGVDERLSTAVANISGTVQECLVGLEAATSDVYTMFSETLNAHEDAVQAEMARNLERRIDFEAAVREQAMESQNFFQHLMTNIRVACDPAAGSASAASAPRADPSRGGNTKNFSGM